jgi:hypothetical protein
MPPSALAALMNTDHDKLTKVVKTAGMALQRGTGLSAPIRTLR